MDTWKRLRGNRLFVVSSQAPRRPGTQFGEAESTPQFGHTVVPHSGTVEGGELVMRIPFGHGTCGANVFRCAPIGHISNCHVPEGERRNQTTQPPPRDRDPVKSDSLAISKAVPVYCNEDSHA